MKAPSIASRQRTEAERDRLFGDCEVLVSEDGMYVERDVSRCASSMYSKYSSALRNDFTSERPATLLVFADATGGWRGSAVTHVEAGTADWLHGKSLSRLAIEPIALGEGKDDNMNLHAMLDSKVAPSVNSIIKTKTISRCVDGVDEQLPAKVLFSADFQAHKAASGQHSISHPIWCDCADVWVSPSMESLPTFTKWEHVEAWLTKIGCRMKTLQDLYRRAHMSYELEKGLPFKKFHCGFRGCKWQSGELRDYRAYTAKIARLNDDDLKEAKLNHSRSHAWKLLLQAPVVVDLDMDHYSPDDLHLVYLNIFKRFFAATVYDKLNSDLQAVAEDYLKAAGFPIRLRGEDPTLVCNWIGRDAKKFMATADLLLPHLLQLANMPEAAGDAARKGIYNGARPHRSPCPLHFALRTRARAQASGAPRPATMRMTLAVTTTTTSRGTCATA